jgi:tetratricopeptide (TPR) repeat protein
MNNKSRRRELAVAAIVAVAVLMLTGCVTAYGRGEAALRAGRPADALVDLEKAWTETPERIDVRIALAIARYRTGAWNAAADILAGVVAEAPRRADARLFLGLAHLMGGDVDAARADLETVRSFDLHPRVASQLDRMLPFLRADLDDRVRNLVAADLDDAYEWLREVEAAHRTARAPLEPAWSLVWDRGPGDLSLLHRMYVPPR